MIEGTHMISRFVGRLGGVLACAVVAACSASQPAAPSNTGPEELNYTRQMPPIATGDLAARGTVASSSDQTPFDLSELPAGSTAHTMVYRSISGITGSPAVVSGAVFTPPGDPPAGGWPVIGYAHGTVGVTPDCGPTADSRLLGDITSVAIQLKLGYAVAYTDYAGLGQPAGSSQDAATSHAYLEPKSAAFNLIDAVRAARAVVPQLSSRWVALGSSQGGETAWAAAEYFAAYGQGTDLLGAAALVPTADMVGLVQRAESSTLTNDQMFLYPNVIEGLASVDKTIDPNDYLHGVLRDDKATLLACRPPASQRKDALAAKFIPSDAKPSSPAAADRLRQRLTSYALPQQPTKIPLLAIYGGSDQTVPPEWTEVAMGRACALGDTILRIRLQDQGHKLDPGAPLGQWIADRFAGVPAVGNC
jgi:pimeloyl-ACP methyl ester carboxylesterase